MSMKNSNTTIGNRSRDLPVCSAVPQPLRHCVPHSDNKNKYNFNRTLTIAYSLLIHSRLGHSLVKDYFLKNSSVTENTKNS
jgi:hypothetical protein